MSRDEDPRKVWTFPPPAGRRCVAAGLAEVTTAKGRPAVAYYWGRIGQTWAAWPGTSLIEFCRAFHLPYLIAAERLTRKDKVRAAAELSRTRHEIVLREMTVELVRDAASEGRQLARTLDAIQQIGGLGVTYALARLAKFSRDGLLPVASLPSQEVRRCVEIAARAAEMLRDVQELRISSAGAGSLESARAEPVPRRVESVSRVVAGEQR